MSAIDVAHHLAPMPDFRAFADLKQQVLLQHPGVFDASETRLAPSLAGELPAPESLPCPPVGHRCHVAEQWLECFGLPADWKPRALVSQGVRHSLQALLAHWARQDRRVALPSDVYPVYLALARTADCKLATYASFPSFDADVLDVADVLVVADPFKPRGTPLSAQEVHAIERWLRAEAHRRVVVDAVYQFDTRLSESTSRLLATGQAIVLHSLSKGWASPLIAGIALVPEQDVAEFTSVFRPLEVDRRQLALAQGLLSGDRGRPAHLAAVLRSREVELRQALQHRGIELPSADEIPGQYLFVAPLPWTQLLSRHGVLALPASTFGSREARFSIVSSLAPLR